MTCTRSIARTRSRRGKNSDDYSVQAPIRIIVQADVPGPADTQEESTEIRSTCCLAWSTTGHRCSTTSTTLSTKMLTVRLTRNYFIGCCIYSLFSQGRAGVHVFYILFHPQSSHNSPDTHLFGTMCHFLVAVLGKVHCVSFLVWWLTTIPCPDKTFWIHSDALLT